MKKERISQFTLSEPYKALALTIGGFFLNRIARSERWLAGAPDWANPVSHLPNTFDTVGLTVVGVIVASDRIIRLQKRSQTNVARYAAGIMLAGIAANAVAELPETQPAMRATIFKHSTPDPIDFAYGAATSIALFPRSRRWITAAANEELLKNQQPPPEIGELADEPFTRADDFGPNSLKLVANLCDIPSNTTEFNLQTSVPKELTNNEPA